MAEDSSVFEVKLTFEALRSRRPSRFAPVKCLPKLAQAEGRSHGLNIDTANDEQAIVKDAHDWLGKEGEAKMRSLCSPHLSVGFFFSMSHRSSRSSRHTHRDTPPATHLTHHSSYTTHHTPLTTHHSSDTTDSLTPLEGLVVAWLALVGSGRLWSAE